MAKKKEKKDSDMHTKNIKKQKNKKKHFIGVKEFAFNFISIVFALVVLFYFGGRCFYYYSLQSQKQKDTEMTLNGLIIQNNKLVQSGDGLYQDKTGYYFRGREINNYVWFANRMFRVLEVNQDNTVKLVSNDLVSMFMWGEETSYDKSNIRLWLTDDDSEHAGVYYKTIPNPNKFIKKTSYTIDSLKKGTVKSGEERKADNVVSLTLSDYIRSGSKDGFLNNGKLFYLLGFSSDNENLYVEEDGSIKVCDNLDAYGVRSVITLNKNLVVSQGDGSVNNPYVINQGKDINYVDSYVKLGDDLYKVSFDNNGILKMYLNGYIVVDGDEVLMSYSGSSSHFDYSDRKNIAYYLINSYLNSLPYRDYIVTSTYPLGEMSAETGYNYQNIYSNNFDGSISLLNLFDYVSNNELTDFFRNNTTSSVGDVQYVTYSNGIVEETDVKEMKHIVPVISINSDIIKGGTGRIDDPYVVG